MITVNALYAGYGTKMVVSNASLEVAAGECVGLLGPSGSGKTTLLRCLTGELRPRSGHVTVAGWTPSNRRPPPGLVGIVWQDPLAALDKLWTVGACIAEPLNAVGKRVKAADVDRTLKSVRLGHVDQRTPVRRLSVGQAQRVSLARAIAPAPRVIIADEPTSALDPTNAATVARLLHAAALNGTAVLVVSHNEPLLRSFCNRVVDYDTIQLASAPHDGAGGPAPDRGQ